MTDFLLSKTRPDNWERLCGESGALFGSGVWQELLERSFKSRTIYASNDVEGFAISVFRGGPFNIGYLGFPVGGGVGRTSGEMNYVDLLKAVKFHDMPICVRIPVSAFKQGSQLDLPCQRNPETVIENLQDWNLGLVSKNLRRDIKKAERTELVIDAAKDPVIGDSLFDIYSQTVKRHGGSIRYSAVYFQELIKLSAVQPRLRVLIATRNTDIAGFLVVARHGDTAYYLHGGATPEFQKSSPSDLLLNNAIHNAQQARSQTFSLMASPPQQPSLIRYKEKWGGVTRDLKTYTVILSPSFYLFRVVEKLYSLIR